MDNKNINFPSLKENKPLPCLKQFCSTRGGVKSLPNTCANGETFPAGDDKLLDYILEHAKTKQDIIDMLHCGNKIVANGQIVNVSDNKTFKDKNSQALSVDKLWELVEQKNAPKFTGNYAKLQYEVNQAIKGKTITEEAVIKIITDLGCTIKNRQVFDSKGQRLKDGKSMHKNLSLTVDKIFARVPGNNFMKADVELVAKELEKTSLAVHTFIRIKPKNSTITIGAYNESDQLESRINDSIDFALNSSSEKFIKSYTIQKPSGQTDTEFIYNIIEAYGAYEEQKYNSFSYSKDGYNCNDFSTSILFTAGVNVQQYIKNANDPDGYNPGLGEANPEIIKATDESFAKGKKAMGL